jgi:hypothetical protein
MQQKLKHQLYNFCQNYLKLRLDAIQKSLDDIANSLKSETKSSAGDKYETGRAMLHLEKEKQMTKRSLLATSQKIIHDISPESVYSTVQSGALVLTSQGIFYIAISAGKVLLDKQEFFVISLSSPIGKALYNKKKGDSFNFRGKACMILDVL